MKKRPLVSVNIRTYNSAKTLDETLGSIKVQTYPHIEVLIADRYSTDETVAIAKKHHVKVHYAAKLGDARQKNYEQSHGTYVCSVDSDQILDRELINHCVKLCENGYDAITISERSIIRNGTLLERIIAYDKWLIDKTQSTDPVFGTACPRFFRKSLLMKTKWPKSILIFDDTILYAKLLEQGAKVGYLHKPCISHYEVSSWRQIFIKFFRYGKGYLEALRELPLTVTTHSLPRRAYFSRAALSKPHYLIGLFALYVVKAVAATMGMLSSIIDEIRYTNI